MQHARRAAIVGIIAFLTGALVPDRCDAQAAGASWPSRPIRLIVGFAPGGGTDIVGRTLGQRISQTLGQPVVVENRAGASGTIAAEIVAKAAPDGYTLLVGHSNSNAIAPFVLRNVPYDAGRDFTAITYIGYVPNVLVIYPQIPANTVTELVALAKKDPGKYTYASSGFGSTQHLAGALFAKITNIDINHIPYKGSGPAIVDLVAGNVSMNFDTMPPVLEQVKSGKLRALAISTPQRLPQLPNVPTFTEVGITGFDVTNWYSIMGPKGMPRDIVAKIDKAVQEAINDPDIRVKLESQGVQFGPTTPEQFDTFIHAELDKYKNLVVQLHITAE
jgi:tripartite-type tricarboxylate transporter receptor subunit TctC